MRMGVPILPLAFTWWRVLKTSPTRLVATLCPADGRPQVVAPSLSTTRTFRIIKKSSGSAA